MASLPAMKRSSGSWSWSVLARTLTLGGGLGLAVGMLGGSGGCKPKTADLYNEDLAVAICDVRRSCGDKVLLTSMTGTVSFPDDAGCEEAVLMQFEGCGDSCKFRRGYARRCLRRLESLADTCEGSIGPCRRAYRKCEDPNETSRCNLHNCGARIDAPSREGLPWLMLVAVGVWARRRRRSA